MSRPKTIPEAQDEDNVRRGAFGRRVRRRDGDLKRQRLQRGNGQAPIKVDDGFKEDKAVSKSPGLQHWQELVLKYVDKVPIVSASARYYDDSTKRVRYYLADENDGSQIDTSNPAQTIIEILNASTDEIARAVSLRFLIGESRHTFDRTDNSLLTVGAGELFMRGGEYKVRSSGGQERPLGEHMDAWRSYDPDRKYSDLATSSHKPMLDVMEAFVIAYAEERAVSIRLALNTGILAVSEDIFALSGSDADAVGSENSDPAAQLEARFHQMFSMTIQNPRDAASFVPPVVIVPGQNVNQMIEHVSFAADRDKRKIAERLDMLKEEYAIGVDLPADIAKNFMADLNHWNAWSVDESAWKNYLAPKIQATVWDAFYEIGEALGIDTTGLIVGLDHSNLVSNKGMREAAFEGYDLGFISGEAARRYGGFSEADAPSAQEIAARASSDGSGQVDEEVDSEEGEGIAAAAATDGMNLDMMNNGLRLARLQFETELRELVQEVASELVRTDQSGAVVAAAAFPAESIAAAADPDSPDPLERVAALIARTIRRGFEAMSLAAARDLATERAQEWYARHSGRIDQQAERAGWSGARLILSWLLNAGKVYISPREAYGIARSIESEASGGQASMAHDGEPTGARPRVIMEDTDFIDMIREEGSARPVYEWEHGMPAQPFAPHAALDGKRWVSAEERTVLNNPNDFPQSAIYHPGDHDGCTCRYNIEFERI